MIYLVDKIAYESDSHTILQDSAKTHPNPCPLEFATLFWILEVTRRFAERQEQSRPELCESQRGEDERVSVNVGRVT